MGSMDDLPFDSDCFDLVMTSMALNGVNRTLWRKSFVEVHSVLKPGGSFLVVDLDRPRFGLMSLIWYPMLFFKGKSRQSYGADYEACAVACGLVLRESEYVNSLVRRRLFVKAV